MAVIPIPRTNTQGAKPHNPHAAARPLTFQQKMANAGRPPFDPATDADENDEDEGNGNRIEGEVDGNRAAPPAGVSQGNPRGESGRRGQPQAAATPSPAPAVAPPAKRILPKPAPLPIITRTAEFRELFAQRTWLSDGATATALFAKGVPRAACPDELNLTLPALVRDVHREYLQAGCHIVSTNTFGANPVRLAASGLKDKTLAVNRAALRIARNACQDAAPELSKQAFVAGVIGPLGVRMEPLGSMSVEAAQAAFQEQAAALAGADLFVLETFRDLAELRAAVQGIREAVGPEVVLIAQVSVNQDGTLGDGVPLAVWGPELDQLAADAIGINCSTGPFAVLRAIEKLAPLTTKLLTAFPSAGLPALTAAGLQYPVTVEYFASFGPKLLAAGAHMIGGCCGTTPDHLRHLRLVVNEAELPAATPVRSSGEANVAAISQPAFVPMGERSKLGAKLAAGKSVTIVDLASPHYDVLSSRTSAYGDNLVRDIEAAKQFKKAKFDAVSVRTHVGSHLVQQKAGIETLTYAAGCKHSAGSLQSYLLDASALELNNVLCVTGNSQATASGNSMDSLGAVALASRMNQSLDAAGNALARPTSMVVGVSTNPFAPDLELELRRLEAKARSGAEFVVTTPIFDVEAFQAFLVRIQHLKLPVIASILPLKNAEHASFLQNELGVSIPASILQRLETGAGETGVEIACELAAQLRPLAAGLRIFAGALDADVAIRIATSKKWIFARGKARYTKTLWPPI